MNTIRDKWKRRVPAGWRMVFGLMPAVVFSTVIVGWLAYLLFEQSHWSQAADQANMREWISETRVYRKTLSELIREYVDTVEFTLGPGDRPPPPEFRETIREEIAEQLQALTDPPRSYQGQLPLFPEIYLIRVEFDLSLGVEPIEWRSPVPPPRKQSYSVVREDRFPAYSVARPDLQPARFTQAAKADVILEYRLHAYNTIRRDAERRARNAWIVAGLVLSASVGALIWVFSFLRRERQKEIQRLETMQDKEHAERLLVENKLHNEELNRQILEQRLRIAEGEQRAADAERQSLELKSQLYASIGIMAGSYAHNIKNLLVRPNDLIDRCLEVDGLSRSQTAMLGEVRETLGTVTERLQQILRTVRRDPNRSELTTIDLNALVVDTQRTWEEMARDKWKLIITTAISPTALPIRGDLSHLQQAVENLLFNARDATFEMRNHLRDAARANPSLDPAARKQAVIDAVSWKGTVHLRTWSEGDKVVLEVRDNGIGMSDEVRRRCTQTHFTTKRDNALYEGYNAGMGLGLSFVAMVLDHHGAPLEIESWPLEGAAFRLKFPMTPPDDASAATFDILDQA